MVETTDQYEGIFITLRKCGIDAADKVATIDPLKILAGPSGNDVSTITKEVIRVHDLYEGCENQIKSLSDIHQHYDIAAGDALWVAGQYLQKLHPIQHGAKGLIPHGEWLRWLKTHNISASWADMARKVAYHFPKRIDVTKLGWQLLRKKITDITRPSDEEGKNDNEEKDDSSGGKNDNERKDDTSGKSEWNSASDGEIAVIKAIQCIKDLSIKVAGDPIIRQHPEVGEAVIDLLVLRLDDLQNVINLCVANLSTTKTALMNKNAERITTIGLDTGAVA